MNWFNSKIEKIGFEKFSFNLIFIGFLIVIFSIIVFFLGEMRNLKWGLIKSDKFGQFGDIIGGVVGSMWALAGVILFYAAFKKQIEALENQKEATQAAISSIEIQSSELKLQRKELEQTREVFKEQEKTLKIQQFESTFFNLLNLLSDILNSIDFRTTKQVERRAGYESWEGIATATFVEPEYDHITEIQTGRDCLQVMLKRIDSAIESLDKVDSNFNSRKEVIEKHKHYYESDIDPYLGIIKQILKKIDSNPVDNFDEYLDILKAQLTKVELKLIYIFKETDLIDQEYESLIEKYNLLDKIEK